MKRAAVNPVKQGKDKKTNENPSIYPPQHDLAY
jgi:hypothetical protein